ncbi:Phosphoribosylformylglycineamidine synthase synthetase subunit [Patulibacter medicamentivorans]|uniref:Phosphoribosylformylglycinamidine synthase subunit PurL n=1 Tax=Patulibacter medicamentivorans TaxID=1097667 RepID=H0EBK2_9ACTN|nr:phosphoribosylformylglycinamidine synthase subunit PurL [Patulibacter medicamentivorans]EHN08949.1 Phosphoribosylformylglycineamidine synthase synthetase subunit [Patulibacter medicamentivorans]
MSPDPATTLPAPRELAPGIVPVGEAPGVEAAVGLGLTRDEYALVVEKLGREPVQVELAMFSLMWSEHCAYKHSKLLLKTLPTEGPALVLGPGENAGAVDVGDGWTVAFKVESHNHPSAVEPFQGAATGVGGILRDIFALGARPIAVLDALRFGEVEDSDRSRFLLDGAVRGIGHYGNSIGVPNIGGDVYFEGPYETNCLVNAMALGLLRQEKLMLSAATGVGNVVVLFGASTGRDGIGGASVLASAELGEDDADKRPTVQVGDPFEEAKLVECTLELLDKGLLESVQDLGAAGLTSSASEMASKGEVGLDLDVALVPRREAGLEPFEVMVSESQERMLCVVTPDRVDEVIAITDKWDVHGTAIGVVTDSRRFRVYDGDALVGDMPVPALVDDCPLYEIHPQKPAGGPAEIYPAPVARIAGGTPVRDALLALVGSANVADRRPLFEQYDPVVQSRTVRRPGQADAAVLMIPGPAGRRAVVGGLAGPTDIAALEAAEGSGPESGAPIPGVGVSIDGSGRRVAADPYTGTVWNVLECAANLACVGAEPLGLTNNLNFGNPEKPHIAWQLTESVRGLGDACRATGAPVVGGNVSLYNEGTTGPIYPTPVVGMVGKVPDVTVTAPLGFQRHGDAIALVGSFAPQLALSELAKLEGRALPDGLPAWDVERAVAGIVAVREAVRRGELSSAHDIAEGGLLVALAESAIAGGFGATVEVQPFAVDGDARASLFGEAPGGFVVSAPRTVLEALAGQVPVTILGEVGGGELRVRCGGETAVATLDELRDAHGSLARFFA